LLIVPACLHHAADDLDAAPLLQTTVAYLQQHQTAPVRWQAPSPLAFADHMLALSNNFVLVGWMEQRRRPPAFEIVPSAWSLYDAKTGAERWSVRRRGGVLTQSQVVRHESVIEIFEHDDGAARLFALNPQTGAEVSSTPLPPKAAVLARPRTTLVAFAEDHGIAIEGIDPQNGKVRWRTSQPGAGEIFIEADDHLVVGSGTEVCGYETETGTKDFCITLATPLSAIPLRAPERWILQSSEAIAAVDAHGTVQWKKPVAGLADRAVLTGDQLLLRLAPATSKSGVRLAAIATDGGNPLWQSGELKAGAHDFGFASTPRAEHGMIFVSTMLTAWVLDQKNGTILHKERIQGALWPRLPDEIVLAGNNVDVVGENWVLAFDGRSGEKLWGLDVRGSRGGAFAPAWSSWQTAGNVSELATDLASIQGGPAPTSLTGGGSTQSLAGGHLGAVQNRSLAGISFASAGIDGMEAMIHAAQVQRAATQLAHAEFSQVRLSHAVALKAVQVQGDYYLRPMEWLWGQGLFVLNLATGEWQEVITGPAENFSNHFLPHFLLAARTPDGSIVTQGIGLAPERWMPDERFYDYKTVLKSLFCFSAAPPHPAADYAEASLLTPDTYTIIQVK
jgi:outer membrane protein assembly factor BamB